MEKKFINHLEKLGYSAVLYPGSNECTVFDGTVSRTIRLEKCTNRSSGDFGKYYLDLVVGLHDKYLDSDAYDDFPDSKQFLLFAFGVVNGKIRDILYDNPLHGKNAWDDNNYGDLIEFVSQEAIPWLDFIASKDTLIDYYERRRTVGLDDRADEHEKKYGDLLMEYSNYPENSRDSNCRELSILYDSLGNYEKALSTLTCYRDYLKKSFDKRWAKDHIKQFDKNLKMIEERMRELRCLVET